MKVKTKELRAVFDKIRSGIGVESVIEQAKAKNITFDGKYAFTYNGSIGIFFPFKTDFVFSVPAVELIAIIADVSDDEIDIDVSNKLLKISGKNIKAELGGWSDVEDNTSLINRRVRFYKLPENLLDGLLLCSFATAKDIGSVFNGICVFDDIIVGSDDLRVSCFKMKSKVKTSFLIPLSSVLALKDFVLEKYGVEEGWLYLKGFEDILICVRLLDPEMKFDLGEDTLKYFKFEGKEIQFPENIKNLVGKAAVLAEGDFDIDKKITVKVEGNNIICIGKNDIGKISVDAKISSSGSNMEFVINPVFFQRVLSETVKAVVGRDRILFETENFKHLISLYCEEEETEG